MVIQYQKADPRTKTYKQRIDIGFQDLKDGWRNARAELTDYSLIINNHPVMERWEEDYMSTLAAIVTNKGGAILEVGYGMGISASHIQKSSISKHVIIEANADVFNHAKEFAKSASKLTEVMLGFWETVTQCFPNESFNGIFFDTYPLTSEEIHKNHFAFFKEAYRLLQPQGVLTYYSDEISEFSSEHLLHLREAGFANIGSKKCYVSPPSECKYWAAQTILAPIIIK